MTSLASLLTRPQFPSLKLTLPIGAWLQVARERRQLAALSDRQLRDMGIEPDAAARERARPFWDLPADCR